MSDGQGKNLTIPELRQVCYNFLAISQDPVTGANQRNETFWNRITVHYNEHRPAGTEARKVRSLESKYGRIRKEVAKFVGSHRQVELQHPAGRSKEDIIVMAKDLYKLKHPKGKDFKFLDCWLVLKESPRWLKTLEELPKTVRKRKSTEEKGKTMANAGTGESASSKDLEAPSAGDFSRPQGNKSAKEEQKQLRAEESAFKQAAQAQKAMAAANQQRVKILADQALQNHFSTRESDLDPAGLEFFRMRREQELLKLKKQLVVEARAEAATPSAPVVPQVPSMEPAQVPEEDRIVVDGSPDAERSGDDDTSQQDAESDGEDY